MQPLSKEPRAKGPTPELRWRFDVEQGMPPPGI